MAQTRVAAMSMYSELLAMSLAVDDDAPVIEFASEKRLLEELASYRARLDAEQASAVDRRRDAPSRVATELQYDRALIKLCRLHDISCDTAHFTQPSRERRRLEEELAAAGVRLKGEGSHARRRAHAQEPPSGS